jgi:hypothetical protein
MMSKRSAPGCGRWPHDRLKPHLDNQADRERFILVNERLDEESKEEGIQRPTGLGRPSRQ